MNKSGVMKKGHIASYINDTSIEKKFVGEVTFCNVTRGEIMDYFYDNLQSEDGCKKLFTLVNFVNCLFTIVEMDDVCFVAFELISINPINNVIGFPPETPRGMRLTNCKIDYETDDPNEQANLQAEVENSIRSKGFKFTVVQ